MGDGHPPISPNAGPNSATTLSKECLPPLGFTRHITNCRQMTEFLLLSLFSSVGSWIKMKKINKINEKYSKNMQK